ncbi:MAG: hypothetical protein IEMM0008_0639 [bacterium]|nr:MAG: hypothetical protein IEMM0008_0639 [bacterium]
MKYPLLQTILIVFVCFSLITPITGDQSSARFHPDDVLTLESAIFQALSRNAQYQSTIYTLKAKKKDIQEAKALFYYPDVQMTVQYTYQDQNPKTTFPIPNNKINTSLSINKVLYSFGRLGDQISIAEQNYKIALLDVYKARNDLIQRVITAFYTVLLRKQSLKVVFKSNRILKVNVKHQKRKYKVGKTQKYEYLRVKIQYENDKITVLQARDDYIRSLNDLFTLMDKRPIGRLRDLKDKISGSLIKKMKESESQGFLSSLEASIQRSRTSRVDILKLVAQRQILRLNRDVTSSQWKPVLSAFGTINTEWVKQTVFLPTGGFGLSNNLQRTTTYNMGVKLTIPLSELLIPNSATHSKTKSLEYQVKSVDRSIQALMATTAKEISDRYLTYQQSKGNIKRRKRVMNLSKETFKIARKRYNAGTIDYLNYKDIEKQYREARLTYYQELFNFNIAYLQLLESIGVFINVNTLKGL